MRERIWVLLNPEKNVIGVGYNPANAVWNRTPLSITESASQALMRCIAYADEGDDTFIAHGYAVRPATVELVKDESGPNTTTPHAGGTDAEVGHG